MNNLPPVSCMCLTYARPHVLEETLECFLKQDYKGEKELIILNDFDQQRLTFSHSQVKIINTGKRFKSVGEKRNAAAALASHDILFVWDDDDLYLPHRLSYTVNKMLEHKRYKHFFKPARAFTLNDGELGGPVGNLFHSGSAWTRTFFDEVNGYPHMGSGQDWAIELRFESCEKYQKKNYNSIPLNEIFYIYRWAGTGTFHLSGFGKDKPNEKTGNQKVQEYIKKKMEKDEIKIGEVKLNPHWKQDYLQNVKDYIGTIIEND
tara:strand:+ start:1622 stop:2407 length:786 start_codon:yes stop_codon:yes gene_type:complete